MGVRRRRVLRRVEAPVGAVGNGVSSVATRRTEAPFSPLPIFEPSPPLPPLFWVCVGIATGALATIAGAYALAAAGIDKLLNGSR